MSDRPVPGAEGPGGHEAGAPVTDSKVAWRVFVGVGLFIAVIALVYWATSYEESGVVMLVVAAVLALWIGIFLRLQQRGDAGRQLDAAIAGGDAAAAEGRAAAGRGSAEEGEYYLPHASAWPFAIGIGGATIANGLVLGLWVIVPGVALLALGIGGFVRQTRRRD